MFVGVGIGIPLAAGLAGGGSAFSITLTGLSTDSLGNYGAVGGHASIGYTIDPDNGTETVKWSNSSNPADAATYGTGAAPTDFTASDGSTVYLHVTDGGETVTRAFAVRVAPGAFSAQPQITGTLEVGETLTIDEGTFSISATLTVLTFTLDGTDKSGELSGSDWDTTGENVYGEDGTISLAVRATDSYGRTVDSNTITETLTDVPDAVDDLAASDNGDGTVDLTWTDPDNGNSAITGRQYRVDGGSWQTLSGTSPVEVSGEGDGSTDFEIRVQNAVGFGGVSNTATEPVTGTPSFPTLTINSIGPQASDGDVPVDYTLTGASSQLYDLVLYDPADGDPTLASQFNGGDADYTDIGQATLDDSGDPLVLSDLVAWFGDARIALIPVGGSDGDIVASATFRLVSWANNDTFEQGDATTTHADAIEQGDAAATYSDSFDQGMAA